ncbi:MAG: GAF domain-containing protein [Verrucomicrobiota bacterium]|nr:GAF domain-containing protein [Verrucomicrobiota bacterium]
MEATSTTCKKLQEIGAFVLAGAKTPDQMCIIAEMIRAACDYRWVGIYKIVRGDFVIVAKTGKCPPAYPRFPITQGLAGAAVESKQAVMVADVHKDPRYLPTFGSTQSEIVVPVIAESGKVVGLIDVESEKLNAFTENDRDFLEHAAYLIARALK